MQTDRLLPSDPENTNRLLVDFNCDSFNALTSSSSYSSLDLTLEPPKANKRKLRSKCTSQTEERIAPGIIRRRVNGRLSMSFDNHIREKKKQQGKSKGYWWALRMECHRDGVHEAPVAGIVGTPQTGCPSIAISGGYEDDVDNGLENSIQPLKVGYEFAYTGAGGRDLRGTTLVPKNLRTAPQSRDQEASSSNMALMKSCDDKLPVRVIRGFKGQKPWAPPAGFRYDGLYHVTKYYQTMGIAGFKVWKFEFKRLPNQPPIDVEGTFAKDHHQYELAGIIIDEKTGKVNKKAFLSKTRRGNEESVVTKEYKNAVKCENESQLERPLENK